MNTPTQLNLFNEVLHAYTADRNGRLDNATLYAEVALRAGLPSDAFDERVPVGKDGQLHSLLARKVRWLQQSLKCLGILEREDQRGWWKLTTPASKELSEIQRGVALLGFSTDLGLAILGHCDHVFSGLDSQVTLVVTSPPYPLAKPRQYGNVPVHVYVDWLCQTIEPVVRSLADGASVCINLTNDVFQNGSPARSTYLERLTIAMEDRLGLHLMDRLVWSNPSKAPGPVRWASIDRVHLNVGYEPVLWFCNAPHKVRSNNNRVLLPHTERHLRLIQGGGEQRDRSYSDGAYQLKPGRFSNQTQGKIPRNVLQFGHRCADQSAYKAAARGAGLPTHGAPMPLSLAKFLIEFLSEPGDLVADPFGGSFTSAKAAELLGRRWLSTECMAEYLLGGALRFHESAGYRQHLFAA